MEFLLDSDESSDMELTFDMNWDFSFGEEEFGNMSLKQLYDRNVLPLYQEVTEGQPIHHEGEFDMEKEEHLRPKESYVVVQDLNTTSLCYYQKAYKVSEKYVPVVLKRYTNSSYGFGKRSRYSSRSGIADFIIENEIENLKLVNQCVYVQPLLDILAVESLRETWLKFEYTPIGSLQHVLMHADEDKLSVDTQQLAAFASQLTRALQFIHSKNIIHGELTSQNIMLYAPGIVKIANFAVSIQHSDTQNSALPCTGPIYYTAPEKMMRLVAKQKEDPEYRELAYNTKIDIWALGIVLLEIVLRTPPLAEATSDEERTRARFIDFIADLGHQNQGSALHHLFYPHFEVVKHVINNELPMDIDRLKKHMPQLADCPKDTLIVLMGFQDQQKRFTAPDQNPEAIPRFEKLYSVSCYLDFVRQCLFIKQDERPTADELSVHAHVDKPLRELKCLEPTFDTMQAEYKNRDTRKDIWQNHRTKLTIQPVYKWIVSTESQKL